MDEEKAICVQCDTPLSAKEIEHNEMITTQTRDWLCWICETGIDPE